MSAKQSDLAVIGTVLALLGVIVGVLALFRDVFDFKVSLPSPPLQSPSEQSALTAKPEKSPENIPILQPSSTSSTSARSNTQVKRDLQASSNASDTIVVPRNSQALEEKTVRLPAVEGCVSTGVEVASGETFLFSATGQASYGYEGSPVNATPYTNPDGGRFVNGSSIGSKDDPNAIYPGYIGMLVGKIGENGRLFPIGSDNQVRMKVSGNLFLCYNEVKGYLNDNGGAYSVTLRRSSK